MVAAHRHETWDHTASIVAAVYQSSCSDENTVLYPEDFHPGYEPLEDEPASDKCLPVGAVPQSMVFEVMKQTYVRD